MTNPFAPSRLRVLAAAKNRNVHAELAAYALQLVEQLAAAQREHARLQAESEQQIESLSEEITRLRLKLAESRRF